MVKVEAWWDVHPASRRMPVSEKSRVSLADKIIIQKTHSGRLSLIPKRSLVHPSGVEPEFPASEADALSIELRVQLQAGQCPDARVPVQ